MLESLPVNDILTLIDFLIKESEDTKRLILKWFQKHLGALTPQEQVQVDDELLWEYWTKTEEIISEFNEYGGGPEDKEEEAYDWLEDISNLIKKGLLSSQAKMDFIDEAFMEYDKDNSGFEDALMDIFFDMCTTQEEWLFLIENLQKKKSDWRDKLINDILKEHLHDNKN